LICVFVRLCETVSDSVPGILIDSANPGRTPWVAPIARGKTTVEDPDTPAGPVPPTSLGPEGPRATAHRAMGNFRAHRTTEDVGSASVSAAVQIRLFGKVSIDRNGQPLSDISAKALELLCYLLLYRDRAHTREALSGMLWPEAAFSLSKKYLRQTLWQLQAAFAGTSDSQPTADAQALLVLNPGWIRANPKGSWWLDVEAFEQAHQACRDTAGEELTAAQAQVLDDAVRLYQGDLIEAWYQDWCIYERDRLQLTYLAMLEKLMGYCGARRSFAKGIAYGERILRYDPARECTHRQLMLLYYLAGDRTTALRQFDRCAAAVVHEFNLQPSHQTVELYRQIRGDRLEPAPAQSVVGRRTFGEPARDLLLDVHRRLDQIQTSLGAILDQVRRESTAVGQGTNCD
jgi:DNA-binding SARP family transcriptional activator